VSVDVSMSVANFNLLGTMQIASIGNNRSAVSATSVVSISGNTNLPDSNSLDGDFANLLNGSALSTTAPEGAPISSVFADSSNGQIIESGLTLTNPVYGVLPIVPAKQALPIASQPGQEPLSGLPIVPVKQGSTVVQQPGQGPRLSGLPIVPNGQKNAIIPQVIPQISPGEKPLVNTQSQINSVVPAPATPPVTPQQGTQANILSAAQVLAGAVLSPVKNELVGPAASRLESNKTSISSSNPLSSVTSATGQNTSATSSQPLVPVNGSGAAQSGQQNPVANNIIAGAALNNSTPIPVATVVTDTQSMVQSRASDFGLSLEPEIGSSTLASKSTSQSSIGQNATTANPALATKIGAETVSKFAARLAMRAVSGATKFEMRLDPPQLGRIEVKIAMTSDNRVQAVMIVENPEVLQDLQKGADSLRKALMREGFDLGSNDLEFQLSQENNGSEQPTDDNEELVDKQILAQIMAHTSSDDIPDIDTGYGYWLMSEQRIDIRA